MFAPAVGSDKLVASVPSCMWESCVGKALLHVSGVLPPLEGWSPPWPVPPAAPCLQVIRGASIITIEALERVDRGP